MMHLLFLIESFALCGLLVHNITNHRDTSDGDIYIMSILMTSVFLMFKYLNGVVDGETLFLSFVLFSSISQR